MCSLAKFKTKPSCTELIVNIAHIINKKTQVSVAEQWPEKEVTGRRHSRKRTDLTSASSDIWYTYRPWFVNIDFTGAIPNIGGPVSGAVINKIGTTLHLPFLKLSLSTLMAAKRNTKISALFHGKQSSVCWNLLKSHATRHFAAQCMAKFEPVSDASYVLRYHACRTCRFGLSIISSILTANISTQYKPRGRQFRAERCGTTDICRRPTVSWNHCKTECGNRFI